MHPVETPILIIEAARSGSKALAPAIRRHPEIAYLREPNYIWKYRNARIGHDMIPPERATPEICAEIRRRFGEHLAASGKTRLCEKTPANSLRLPFVTKVFPDARIVHLYRDGRDVALSARKMWHGENSDLERKEFGIQLSVWKYTRKRIKDIPLRDLPFYLGKGFGFIRTHLGIGPPALWGPQFPGMKDLVGQYSLLEICALQWRWSVESILNFLAASEGRVQYLPVQYEALCADPKTHLERVFDFVELPLPDNFEEMVAHVRGGNAGKWAHRMTPEEQDAVHRLIGHTLQQLGYKVPACDVSETLMNQHSG